MVVPVYNEAQVLGLLWERLRPVLAPDDELVFVNDGSEDKTAESILQLIDSDKRIRLINFSRNFGHQPAVSAGLKFARGDAVVVMDADLQDPPEMIPGMVERWEEGYDVVHCVRRKRKESRLKRLSYGLFYWMYSWSSEFPMHVQAGDFALMSRRVVDEINRMEECGKFVRGLRSYVGFEQTKIEYDRDARVAGKPKYGYPKLIKLALDGLFSFSTLPLRAMMTGGLLLLIVSFIAICLLTYWRLFHKMEIGHTMTYVLVLFFGGLNTFCLGVIGEYLGRVFYEVKKRPSYIVESVVGYEVGGDKDI
ncbi:MAG: glycosyltransferase family 2 protein [Thermodesulfobacteriota bacterium]